MNARRLLLPLLLLAAATAGFVWALIELIHKGHASILGFCSGVVAGLVVTPHVVATPDVSGTLAPIGSVAAQHRELPGHPSR